MNVRDWPGRILIGILAVCACEQGDRPSTPVELRITLTPIADLKGGEVVNVRNGPSTLVPTPSGGWLYAGYQEDWTWAEFSSAGALIRAPGEQGPGGPGEFRGVIAAFPLDGDTLMVLSSGRATRVLRDGTYIDQQPLMFTPRRWALHAGEYWVSGYGGSGEGVPLMRIQNSGALTLLNPLPGTANPTGQSTTGHPVSWNGALWLWEYPRGPLHRIGESGQVVEEWFPDIRIDEDEVDTWRAFPTARGDTLIFRVDPTMQWVAFDANRAEILNQPIPEEWRAAYPLDERYMRGETLDAEEPEGFIRTPRVYEYRLRR